MNIIANFTSRNSVFTSRNSVPISVRKISKRNRGFVNNRRYRSCTYRRMATILFFHDGEVVCPRTLSSQQTLLLFLHTPPDNTAYLPLVLSCSRRLFLSRANERPASQVFPPQAWVGITLAGGRRGWERLVVDRLPDRRGHFHKRRHSRFSWTKWYLDEGVAGGTK